MQHQLSLSCWEYKVLGSLDTCMYHVDMGKQVEYSQVHVYSIQGQTFSHKP